MNGQKRTWTLVFVTAALALLVLALLLVTPQFVRAGELRVGPDGTYPTIQAALNAAAPGDTILVQEGTYVRFEITKSVTLLGGWNAAFTSRKPRESVIDGRLMLAGGAGVDGDARPPVNVVYPAKTNTQSEAAIQSNFVGSGIEVVIDGFEIKDGSAANGGGIFVQVADDSRVVINDNFIHDNEATAGGGNGGGIWADLDNRCSLEVTNNRIVTNTANTDGGGLYLRSNISGTIKLTDNKIVSNTASTRFGGFWIDLGPFGHFQIEDNVVMSNTTSSDGYGGFDFNARENSHGTFDRNKIIGNRAGAGYGGGEIELDFNCSTTFYDNEFRGNVAGAGHGGLHLDIVELSQVTGDNLVVADNKALSSGGGEFYAEDRSVIRLPNTKVTGNEARSGDTGGLYLDPDYLSTIDLPNLEVKENKASSYAGGILLYLDYQQDTVLATNAQIISNTALNGSGGGIYVELGSDTNAILADLTGSTIMSNTVSHYGGGLYVGDDFQYGSNIVLSNTMFLTNTADREGGGAYFADGPTEGSVLEMSNSEFISNTAKGGHGGGAYIYDAEVGCRLTVDDAIFRKNYASQDGGGLFIGSYEYGCSVSVQDGTFEDNEAGNSGGAIYFDEAEYGVIAHFDGNTFTSNEAGGDGGAFYGGEFSYNGSWASFSGNTLKKNKAEGEGGAVFLDYLIDVAGEAYFNDNWIEENEAGGYGGGAVLGDSYFGYEGSYSEINGNTVKNNISSGEGAGLYLYEAEGGCRVEFRDNTITGNVISSTTGYGGGGVYIYELIDGCVMWMTGNKINDNVATQDGGGLHWYYDSGSVDEGAVLYFEDNELQRNWAGAIGGGCYFEEYIDEGAGFHFNRNLVNDNTSLGEGGGCHFGEDIDDGNPVSFVGNQFNRNTAAGDYGGLYFDGLNEGAHMRFWDNQIIGNRAGISDTVYAEGKVTKVAAVELGGDGGGLWFEDISEGAVVDMRRNQVLSNTAYLASANGGDHGGLYAQLDDSSARLTMADNTIAGNRAEDSFGGLHIDLDGQSRLVMVHNTIQANTAVTESGGLHIYGEDDSQYYLLRNKFLDNVAGAKGGLWIENNGTTDPLWGLSENNLIAGNLGSGIYLENADFWSTNDTIADNGAYGLLITTTKDISSTAYISNAIVWGNASSFVNSDPANCAIHADYSDIQGGYAGSNNKNQDPLFVNAAANDYHLQGTSPAVGAARTATAPVVDLDGIPRPVPAGGEADMGCYEWFRAGVTLAPDGAETVNPGSTASYDLMVTNDGNVPDTFAIDVPVNPLGWAATASPASVDLAVGGSTTVQVKVTVPAGTDAGVANQVTVRATSQRDGTVVDIAQLETTAAQVAAVTLKPDLASGATPGSLVGYVHTVTNKGNATDTFTLDKSSSLGWTVLLSPTVVTLAKDGEQQVEVYVTIPSDAVPGAMDETTLTATSVADGVVSDTAVDTTTSYGYPIIMTFLPIVTRDH